MGLKAKNIKIILEKVQKLSKSLIKRELCKIGTYKFNQSVPLHRENFVDLNYLSVRYKKFLTCTVQIYFYDRCDVENHCFCHFYMFHAISGISL